jgi:hypothetical protein
LQGRAANTSTGSAVSNLLPMLVDDGEPPVHGKRGADPSRVTASATGPIAPSGSGLGNPSEFLTAAETQCLPTHEVDKGA